MDMSDIGDYKTARFPVLNRSNYREWLDLVEDVLTSKGLWSYTQADEELDSSVDQKERQQNDAKAVAFLKQAVGSENRVHLIGLRRSRDILRKIQALNEGATEERAQTLLTTFYGFSGLPTIDEAASRLTQLQNEIGGLNKDERPSDSSKKAILLQSLGDEFQSTIFALQAAGLAKLSFEELTQRLKDVEKSMSKSTKEDLARTATAPRHGMAPRNGVSLSKAKRGNEQRQGKGRPIVCYYCDKPGHIARDCQRKAAKNNNGHLAWNDSNKSRVAKETTTDAAWTATNKPLRERGPQAKAPSVFEPEETLSREDWVLDSGCTRHMTYDRSLFKDYEHYRGSVTLADGKSVDAMGRGSIILPIEGKKTAVPDVILVPELGYNLLSISQLADRGISTIFGPGEVLD